MSTPLFPSDYAFRDIYLLASATEDEPDTDERAIHGLEGWIACYEKCRLAGTVFAGGAPRTQAVDEELGQSFDNLVALASEITQNRQTDGQVAAQLAAAFDQHDAQALACRRTCGHDARRAAAHDEHVHFGANRNLPPEFRNRFFLICHICNVLRFILRFWVFRGVPCATG